MPEAEITVTGTVAEGEDGLLAVGSEAVQDGKRLVRNGRATIRRS